MHLSFFLFLMVNFAHAAEYEGRVRAVIADQSDESNSVTTYTLKTEQGETILLKDVKQPLQTGAIVKIQGTKSKSSTEESKTAKDSLSVQAVTVIKGSQEGLLKDLELDPNPEIKMRYRKVAVILVNFQSNPIQPFDTAIAKSQTFSLSHESGTNHFYNEITYGKMRLKGVLNPSGDVFGWYTIADPSVVCNSSTYLTFGDQIYASVAPIAANQGFVESNYDHIVMAFPGTNCDNIGGWAELPGKLSWSNGYWHGNVTHEIGHNLGLNHANALICTQSPGVYIPFSELGNCLVQNYGDPFSLMGGGYRHYNDIHKEFIGAFSAFQIRKIQGTGPFSSIINLAATESSPSSFQSIKIYRRASEYFYLEKRKVFGIYDNFPQNSSVVNGVLVHHTSNAGGWGGSQTSSSNLLDMHPNAPIKGNRFNDAALQPGEFYYDSSSGVRISVLPAKSLNSSASVKVEVLPISCSTGAIPQVTIANSNTAQNRTIVGSGHLDIPIKITNRNAAGCIDHNEFVLSSSPPSLAFTTQFIPNTLTIKPGETVNAIVRVTPNSGAGYGIFNFAELVRVTDSNDPSASAVVSAKLDRIPLGCTRNLPSISVNPTSTSVFSTAPSVAVSYSVTNMDSSLCPAKQLQFRSVGEGDYYSSLSPFYSVTLNPGETATVSDTWQWPMFSNIVLGTYTVKKSVFTFGFLGTSDSDPEAATQIHLLMGELEHTEK